MPNLEPNPNAQHRFVEYPKVGSRQKREENLAALINFLQEWRVNAGDQIENGIAIKVAERFCDMNFKYGYATKKDITEQALIHCDLMY